MCGNTHMYMYIIIYYRYVCLQCRLTVTFSMLVLLGTSVAGYCTNSPSVMIYMHACSTQLGQCIYYDIVGHCHAETPLCFYVIGAGESW